MKEVLTGPHTHNNFLEVFVETGVAGGMFFVAFTLLLLLALLRKIRFYKSGSPATSSPYANTFYIVGLILLGLFIATHIFGMTNYSLRRSLGLLVWTSWALAFAFVRSRWDTTSSPSKDNTVFHH